jgi:tetratricopeptide (TPR) repeat protein
MKKISIHIILIVLLGLLAYSNTFHVPFQFDDRWVIVENPIIKDLQYFTEPSKAEGFETHLYNTFKSRYIGFLTFALNYKLHGLDVTGYHIFNLLIHLINAILVYWLVVLTFKTPFLRNQNPEPRTHLIAFFSSLLFACHPIQTQAVTYIWQRVTSLATLFYLLSLVMYIKARFEVKAKVKFFSASTLTFYSLSLISAILAMKTKEIAFTLPVVITLYEFMFFKEKLKRRILYLIPLLFTMLIIPLTFIGIDKPLGNLIGDVSEVTKVQTEMSRLTYLFTQYRVIVTYIRLLFLPINQNLDYDYPIYNSFFNPNVFLSFIFLLSILGLGVYLLYRSRFIVHSSQSELRTRNSEPMTSPTRYTPNATRLIAFSIFWFFITLSVESSIIPIVDIIFEHRVYLPSVGAIIAFSIAVFYILQFTVHSSRFTVYASRFSLTTVYFLLPAIVIAFSIVTYQRNLVWQDEVTLWEDVVKKSPNKSIGHNNVGLAYFGRGWIDKAIEHYWIALRLKPDNAAAHNNIGVAYETKGWTDQAAEHYLMALELISDFPDAHANLANLYLGKGWLEEAMKHFQIALKLKPDNPEMHNNLGNIFYSLGRIEEAIQEYRSAIKLNPNPLDAYMIYYNLGVAYENKGLLDEAIEAYKIAIERKPDYAEAHNDLGVVYEKKGLLEQAVAQYRIALSLNPGDKVAKRNLERIIQNTK